MTMLLSTPPRRAVVMALVLATLAAWGCGGDDMAGQVKHATLQELGSFALGTTFYLDEEDGLRVSTSLEDKTFRPPNCPVVTGLEGTLDGRQVDVDEGSADEQRDIVGNKEVVCQPPGFIATTNRGRGEHVVSLTDGTSEVEMRVAIAIDGPTVTVVSPVGGHATKGEEVSLRLSPPWSGAGPAVVSFRGAGGTVVFSATTPSELQIDDDGFRFAVPDDVDPQSGELEVFIDGWSRPVATRCIGATACPVEVVGGSGDTVSLPFEIVE